jgi:DNA-binding NarL/FixJ family response regulator
VADGRALLTAAAALAPDVIVTDIGLPHVNGLEAAREILRRDPDARVVFVTVDSSPEVIQRGLDLGALGYVLKLAAGDDLVPAIQSALRGRRYVSTLPNHSSSSS